ncbi:molybdate ABC transporter substrate-binding protein [Kineobactrum sediminis]|uniref:Molybdate ABC transporter substrate-binding protein n=1 Tax=Kineobactrum sediminis TaxID=1905677 RepID=A0A2N5Y1P3_9GAMM|nr:molybdate ABC transporter substrate-binding protein [Kineobactrum sediminis]PLW82314.1 molybdate ABC transporter substrate-binding protein [Kineobactrum sediminis]
MIYRPTAVSARLLAILLLSVFACTARANSLTIAAASDLRFALEEIVTAWREQNPDQDVRVVYGSSGKMSTQISNGAPYDLFFSADISYPQQLQAQGFTATDPVPYATGRIVLWSSILDASALTLADLTGSDIEHIAIAQPAHAPYGLRAQEALQAAGIWEQVQSRLVFAENIAQAAQMAESGAATVGIIALSLAEFPRLAQHPYHLIPASKHQPLRQAYVVTRRADNNAAALSFARFMTTDIARAVMARYGFAPPGEPTL